MALANMSARAQTLNDLFSHITPYYRRLNSNLYNKKTNPTGILNFAKAENMLCEKEIAEKLNTIQGWTVAMNHYGNAAGEIELRQALCSFFQENLRIDKQELTIDRMLITGGADGAFIVYSYLLADPGDVMLIPSPYYSMIDLNVSILNGNKTFPCPLINQNTGEFRLLVDIFKCGYDQAIANDLRPRIIVLINPHNPLGDIYDEATIRPILEFAAEKQLHVIIDEIYAFSLFTDEKPFESMLNYTSLPDPTQTHFIWSFSKDFTLSGARVGVIYAGIAELCDIATKFNFLLAPSRVVQQTLATFLTDREWIRSFIVLNRSRLTNKFLWVKSELELMGISVRNSRAGFFIWADFRPFMKEVTFEEENRLFQLFFEHGIFIWPGQNLGCTQPGWFRFIFSLKDCMITEGLKRIKTALNEFTN